MSISDPSRAKLRCPICNTPTTVVDSRKSGTVENAIRRRRKFPECEVRFTTIEGCGSGCFRTTV